MRIMIQDLPLRLLSVLAENAGQVVTRYELPKRRWPEDTFVDFEDGLNTAVKKLREALDDDPEKPRYIETIPRRGYRFLAEVERVPPASDRAVVSSAQRPSSGTLSGSSAAIPRRARHWKTWVAAAVAVLVILSGPN